MRIVFFGTPAFAVPSLDALLAEGAQVVGVVTQPDKPQGRSRSILVPPPIKLAADARAWRSSSRKSRRATSSSPRSSGGSRSSAWWWPMAT